MTDRQWLLPEPLLSGPGKRGPKHRDLRGVVDGILYVIRTGCQWRYLPESFGPWTRVWSQFRRWSRNGTWTGLVTALHEQVRLAADREAQPSMLVIDSSLARAPPKVAPRSTTGAGRTVRRWARNGSWRWT